MILIEDGPQGRPALFDGAERLVLAETAAQVAPALAELDAARAAGKWVAGMIAYEAGYALEQRLLPLMPPDRSGPLLAFGIYDAPVPADAVLAEAQAVARQLAAGPTTAFGGVKRLLDTAFSDGLETQLDRETRSIADMMQTHDGPAGIAAFLAKQKPVFEGK